MCSCCHFPTRVVGCRCTQGPSAHEPDPHPLPPGLGVLRTVDAIRFDMDLLASNAELFHGRGHNLARTAAPPQHKISDLPQPHLGKNNEKGTQHGPGMAPRPPPALIVSKHRGSEELEFSCNIVLYYTVLYTPVHPGRVWRCVKWFVGGLCVGRFPDMSSMHAPHGVRYSTVFGPIVCTDNWVHPSQGRDDMMLL